MGSAKTFVIGVMIRIIIVNKILDFTISIIVKFDYYLINLNKNKFIGNFTFVRS